MKNNFSITPGPGNKGLSINLSLIEATTCVIGAVASLGFLIFKNAGDNKNKNEYFLDDFDDSII